MDPRLLRYFLAVVDAGSLARAAGVVHVAEPSLSRQVRRLEAQLGWRCSPANAPDFCSPPQGSA